MLALCCCTETFSSYGVWLLIAGASLVAEHGL